MITRVRFSPRDTRFRLIPKILEIGMNCRYYYYVYSFLSCRWYIKRKKPKSFYKR